MIRALTLPVALHTVVLTLLPSITHAQALANQELSAFDCVITPYAVIDLSSAVPGLVEQVHVEKSDRVTQGQVVAELEAGVERASVALAKARSDIQSEVNVGKINLDFDQRRKKRMDSLYQQKVASPQNKDEADREAELSVWRLQQAKDLENIRKLELKRTSEQLQQKIVRSPIDGFVVKKLKSAGEYVEDEAILRIAQLDPLSVEAIVPMALFGQIEAGMSAQVYSETAPAESRNATVNIVDRIGDTASGTFGVRLTLPNPNHQIPAGIKCMLKLDAEVAKQSNKQRTTTPKTFETPATHSLTASVTPSAKGHNH